MTKKKECPFCGQMISYGYPGGDPEAGTAGYYCDNSDCSTKEYDAWYAGLSQEDKDAIEKEANELDERYREYTEAMNVCPDCGAPNELQGHMSCQYPTYTE